MQYKFIVADDHPLLRTAIKSCVVSAFDDPIVYEAASIDELQMLMENTASVSLILLDLSMPGAHGYSGLIFLRATYPNIPVVVISSSDEMQVIQKVKDYGANGFVSKSAPLENLKPTLLKILNGENDWPATFQPVESTPKNDIESRIATLTPQQFRVLGMISEGLLNKQIAYYLKVSEATVKAHVTAIFKKLGVRNRTQAVIAVKELELADPNPQDEGDSPSS